MALGKILPLNSLSCLCTELVDVSLSCLCTELVDLWSLNGNILIGALLLSHISLDPNSPESLQ